MNDSGDSLDCASSKCSTTVPSSPVAASSSRRCSGDVSSCGADSGRTIGRRVAVEREDDGSGALALGQALDLGDDRLVAAMHAVVGADRDHGALAGPGRGVDLGDHLHGR